LTKKIIQIYIQQKVFSYKEKKIFNYKNKNKK